MSNTRTYPSIEEATIQCLETTTFETESLNPLITSIGEWAPRRLSQHLMVVSYEPLTITLFSSLQATLLTLPACPWNLEMFLPSNTSVSRTTLSPPPVINLLLSLLMSMLVTSQLCRFLQTLTRMFFLGLQRQTPRSSEPLIQYSPEWLNFRVQMGPVWDFGSL